MCITEGTFPKLIVVFNVPDESGRGIAGDLDPRGLDFGETCSGLRIGSFMMFIFSHNLDLLDCSPVIYNGYMTGSGSTGPEVKMLFIDTISKTNSGCCECGLGWLRGGLGCFPGPNKP